MNCSHVTCALLSVAALACGGAQTNVGGTVRGEATVDDNSRVVAPDLAARVDRANADARDAAEHADEAAAADHRERARLWRVALGAEVERIALERDRLRALAELEAIETGRIANEQTRATIEFELKRERAREIARAEAVRVLTEAESDEARRRGGDPARVASRREASRALIDRSSAMLAAAIALGADGSTVESAQRAIQSANRRVDGTAAGVTAAHAAFALTQRALGQARSKRPSPDVHERASLLEALGAHGWSAELLDEGVVVSLTDLFAGNRNDLRPGARTLLADLAAILSGHPHGPIQVQVTAAAAVTKSSAQRRAQRLKAALVGVDSGRIEIVAGVDVSDQPSLARVVLTAYGCNAIANDPAQCTRASSTEPAAAVDAL